MGETAIRVENLCKRYRIGERQRYKTLRDALFGVMCAPFRGLRACLSGEWASARSQESNNVIWALKDVSFDVKRGEVVGIIGRNGAGKSTLLKILSRITKPTKGFAEIHGRVGSLLEVGTGFHPELTGRENIYLNGAILGIKRQDIGRKFDEIIAFAEVERFIDTPIKHYSSGMYMRLAFAVAAHLEPEILLVDEVLAVGDVAFQKKCMGKMGDVAKEGRTVLLISHNMAAVEHLCQRGVVLHQGQIQYIGNKAEAIAHYLKSLGGNARSLMDRKDRIGSGAVRVVSIDIKDVYGNTLDSVASAQDLDIYLYFVTATGFRSRRVIASLMLKTQLDVPVFLHHNRLTRDEFGELPESGAFVCRLQRLPLPPSNYQITYSILADGECLDGIDNAAEITVVEGDFFGSGEVPPISHGVCLAEGRWRLLPGCAPSVLSRQP